MIGVAFLREWPPLALSRAALGYFNVLSLLYWGGLLSSAFRLFSIDPVVMSVAGSALLFGIGTKALP